jgi:hypothetical protein
MSVLDAYERRARLQPALIAGCPLAVAVMAAGIATNATVGVALTLATQIGLIVVLAEFARRLGKRLEPGLVASWGGPPTTAAMRHNGSTDPHRRALLRRAVERLVPGVVLPTAEDERASPADADARYGAATEAVRSIVRADPAGTILAAENANYGFHRNLLGLKPLGLAVAAITALVALTVAAVAASFGTTLPALAVTAVAALVLMFWTFYVRPERVRWAAERYADAFFGAVVAACNKATAVTQ